MFKFTFMPRFNADGGDGGAVIEPPSVEAGGENPSEAGNAPESGSEVTKQESFAKRLKESTDKAIAEERAKWEKEYSEKYKDHDTYKKAAEYLQKTSGFSDIMTLKEEIELQELQERADKENVPASVLKRIDELEAKAAKADELEAKVNQEKAASEFEHSLKDFVADKQIDGKPVSHTELWSYMHENGITKPEAALKAMKADILEAKLATAKEDAVKEYLNSKKGVKTEGSTGAAAHQIPQAGGGFKGAEQRAIARIAASKSAE